MGKKTMKLGEGDHLTDQGIESYHSAVSPIPSFLPDLVRSSKFVLGRRKDSDWIGRVSAMIRPTTHDIRSVIRELRRSASMSFSVHKPVCWSLHCDSVCTVQRFPKGRRKETYTNHMRLSVIGYGLTSPPTCSTPQRNGRCVPPSLPLFGSGGRIER